MLYHAVIIILRHLKYVLAREGPASASRRTHICFWRSFHKMLQVEEASAALVLMIGMIVAVFELIFLILLYFWCLLFLWLLFLRLLLLLLVVSVEEWRDRGFGLDLEDAEEEEEEERHIIVLKLTRNMQV